ncbi:methyltransferase domain-containing protein [Lysobacter maris]|uniref:Methyltransferase domain-containing protein n=1 Tax=Marilutibacter maris TaxID=1605891 RepID=A0A508B113_9GAMM|nr:methyltransferase domain-containing protein [Lysobacter maris]KAB8188534.1 methyltransferase domain-containing protein [Lysobacter maris]
MSDDARPLPSATARAIARAYRPAHPLGSYWDYFYVRGKLSSDPLYPGIVDALRGTSAPVLDLGCGLGLLAHALRDAGLALPYRGVDIDAGKIARAARAATRAGLGETGFARLDLARGLPAHRGSVAVLDVLQFVPRQAHDGILDGAIAMLAPGAKLVIRTGFDDGGSRARVTRAVDVFSRVLGWMNAAPRHYPEREALCARLADAGLRVEVDSLSGDTPFNNWRVVAHAP